MVEPLVMLVRSLALLALLGCGSGERAPAPGTGSSAPSGDRISGSSGKRSIDVSVTGAPVAIRGVEILPGKREGELEVGYRVDASTSVRIPARVMCRIGGRNVVYPDDAWGKVAGPRLTSVFRPDPFREPVGTCEIACKDTAGVTSGEGALAFVPLDTIPVGASIYGPLTVVLERTPAPDASCDVLLVSRATTAGAPEQTHARYCITSRAVRAGPC